MVHKKSIFSFMLIIINDGEIINDILYTLPLTSQTSPQSHVLEENADHAMLI